MSRQAVSKHLAVLEGALLVTTVRRGREKLHYLNAAPINEIADRWIHTYDRARVSALADLKRALETPAMDKPEFVYTTYIRTTPERLWAALTEPAFTERYWDTDDRHRLEGRLPHGVGSTAPVVVARPRAGRARVRPPAPAVVHLAHVLGGVGRHLGHRRGPARPDRGRTAVAGHLRARARRPAGEAHGGARRLRARQRGRRDGEWRLAAGARGPEVPARGGHERRLLHDRGRAHASRRGVRRPHDTRRARGMVDARRRRRGGSRRRDHVPLRR